VALITKFLHQNVLKFSNKEGTCSVNGRFIKSFTFYAGPLDAGPWGGVLGACPLITPPAYSYNQLWIFKI